MDIKRILLTLELLTIVTQSIFAGPKEDKALFEAVEKGDLVGVENALKSGANINTQDKDGYTVLMHAAEKGNSKTVQTLLAAKGVDVNLYSKKNEQTALMLTAFNFMEGFNSLKLLLAVEGININAQDRFGKSVLILAVKLERSEFIKTLLAVPGIDVTLKTKDILGHSNLSNKTAWDFASDEMKKEFPALQPKQTMQAPVTTPMPGQAPVVSTTPAATPAN